MQAIRAKKVSYWSIYSYGPRDNCSVTISLSSITIGSSGIFSLMSLYRANLYISSFSLELTRIDSKTW